MDHSYKNIRTSQIDVVIGCGAPRFQSLYVSLQMLKFYNIFNKIVVLMPQDVIDNFNNNCTYKNKISDLVDEFILSPTYPGYEHARNAGNYDGIVIYFENKNNNNAKHMLYMAEDVWLMNIESFTDYYNKYLILNKEAVLYYQDVGKIWIGYGGDFFILNSSEKVRMKNIIETTHNSELSEPLMCRHFKGIDALHITQTNASYNVYWAYGYSCAVGKSHMHHGPTKVQYANFWKEYYNHHILYEESTLISEQTYHEEGYGFLHCSPISSLNDNFAYKETIQSNEFAARAAIMDSQ